MTVPVLSDFIVPFLDDLNNFSNFNISETSAQSEFNRRFQPDLGFTVLGGDMNMHSCLFPREKEESVLLIPEYGRAHSFKSNIFD